MRAAPVNARFGIAVLCAVALSSAALAREPIGAGLNDLVVYDSGMHGRGLPAIVFEDGVDGTVIDVAAKVHVHRYYYSGDKEYQGPIIEGGPTVVVANHPKNGNRMYIDVVLAPGAPRIAYSKTSITYVYPDQRIGIYFRHFPFNSEKAIVKYHGGRGIGREIDDWYGDVVSSTRTHFQQSELAQSVKEAAYNTGDFVCGVGQSLECAGARILDGTGSLIQAFPGVTPVQSMGQQRAERIRAAEIRGADLLKQHTETPFVVTNR
jgi:hypothetical protein